MKPDVSFTHFGLSRKKKSPTFYRSIRLIKSQKQEENPKGHEEYKFNSYEGVWLDSDEFGKIIKYIDTL